MPCQISWLFLEQWEFGTLSTQEEAYWLFGLSTLSEQSAQLYTWRSDTDAWDGKLCDRKLLSATSLLLSRQYEGLIIIYFTVWTMSSSFKDIVNCPNAYFIQYSSIVAGTSSILLLFYVIARCSSFQVKKERKHLR